MSSEEQAEGLSLAKRLEFYRRVGVTLGGGKIMPVPARDPYALVKIVNARENAEDEFALYLLDVRPRNDITAMIIRRQSFVQRWVPPRHPPPKRHTIIFFDWDDTLLCTTHLILHGEEAEDSVELGNLLDKKLDRLQTHAKTLLDLALTLGRVFIVTNALTGWVEESAARYIPLVLPALKK
eukprot:Platyproteum_vivax@DN5331_c0_g1_i3.p1